MAFHIKPDRTILLTFQEVLAVFYQTVEENPICADLPLNKPANGGDTGAFNAAPVLVISP